MGNKREWRRIGVLALLLVLALWSSPALAGERASTNIGDTEIPDACFGSVCVAKATPMSDMGMDWGEAARGIRTGKPGVGHSGGGTASLGK